MQIKQQALKQQIQNKLAPLYVLIGQDNYLINESLNTIRSTLKNTFPCDEKIMNIQDTADWNLLREEANSYSLFSETVLLNASFEKKSIEAAGKKTITEYLNSINPRCYIIIRAPNVPAKQILWLSNHDKVVVVVAYPLNKDATINWIISQLKNNSFSVHPQVPELIYQYTQGNMLACAQVIEKIALTQAPNSQIQTQHALLHLSNQCDISLFELVEACLLGQADKAIQILRLAVNNKTEPTLVLWILAQEVRVLLQLSYLIQKKMDVKSACSQLKIWPQRINLYQLALKRLNNESLQLLLRQCQIIDERIKSNLNHHVWNTFELLALSLCTGTLLGDLCVQ